MPLRAAFHFASTPFAWRLPCAALILLGAALWAPETRADAKPQAHLTGQVMVLQDISAIGATPTVLQQLDSAPEETLAGRLRVYRDHHRQLVAAIRRQYITHAEYERLSDLTDEAVDAEFPDGGYIDALGQAHMDYVRLRKNALMHEETARKILLRLTNGRQLSDKAMNDLHRLLGL